VLIKSQQDGMIEDIIDKNDEKQKVQETRIEGKGILDKENVLKMHCNLENIVIILEEAFKFLQKIEGKNIILAVGNTGCGKSTMLTSLMYGPEALELKKIDYEIKIPQQKGQVITK
jgi:predicted GTPase